MPLTVQMLAALLVVKVKAVNPLDAVAVRVMADAPKVTGVAGAKLMVWLAVWVVMLSVAVAGL